MKSQRRLFIACVKTFFLGALLVGCKSALIEEATAANLQGPTMKRGPASAKSGSYPRDRRKNTVLLKVRDGASPEELKSLKDLYAEFDLRAEKKILNDKVVRLRIHASSFFDQEEHIVERLKATGAVAIAEPDFAMPHAIVPNDPYYSQQWHHKKVNSESAWNYSKGSTAVLVGVCDAGFDLSHPELASQFSLPGYNTVKNSTEVSNLHPHGTQTSGVIGAIGNNNLGVAGMAWQIKILPIQISDLPDGASTYSDVAECIQYAADRGAKVVNLSYDYAYTSAVVNDAASYLRSAGGLLVAAAGNGGGDISTWGASPNMLIAGATDSNDVIASFSNFGSPVDLVAPGVDIYTTYPGGLYDLPSGTSFSTPMAAGTAALIYSLKPSFTPAQVEGFLLSTARDLGPTSYDLYYAGGRLEVGLALQKAAASVGSDTIAPVLVIDSPVNNATVSGSVVLKATASDNVGVASVAFYVEANLLGTKTAPPYEVTLNTANLSNGSHSISAKALDSAGNNSIKTISVLVNNPVTSPTITLDNLSAYSSDANRTFTGKWCNSNLSGFYGTKSVTSCGSSTDTYRFTPSIPTAKNYKIFVRYLSHQSFSRHVPVVIKYSNGSTTQRLNMKSGGSSWVLLGTYNLSAGTANFVQFSDSAGTVNVDAVRFEPAP